MAGLPSDVGTGIIHVRLRRVGVVSQDDQDANVDPVSGKVTFTPSPTMLRHIGQGLMFPAYPVTAYLDATGNADVQLMATNDPQISPLNWTYTVSFDLEDNLTIDSFSIEVPEGSDRELSDLTPVVDNTGTYYLTVGPAGPASTVPGPQGPTGPQGPQGPAGTNGVVDSQTVANVLGVEFYVGDTVPAATTGSYGKPLVWVTNGSVMANVPVTPTAPAFDFVSYTITPPTVTGVTYQYKSPTSGLWIDLTQGSATSVSGFTRPWIVNVRAVAKNGYALTASYTWTALFTDASALSLAASESFDRTAGTILAPTQGVAGLAFNMAAGGSESPAPNWWQYHSAGNDFGIQTGGTQVGRYPPASGNSALWFVTPTNFAVEVDINGWTANHSRSFSFYIAAPASGTYGTAQPTVSWSTPSANSMLVNFSPATGMTGTTSFTHYASGTLTTESQLTGTYRVVWMNKYLQVTMPNGAVYGRDYTSMTYVPTTWSFLRTAESDATVIKFNNFRKYT